MKVGWRKEAQHKDANSSANGLQALNVLSLVDKPIYLMNKVYFPYFFPVF